jgi:hypothetical protein
MLDHRNDVLAGRIVACWVVSGCIVWDVDVVVGLGLAALAPDLVGPAADVSVADVLILVAEQIVDRGLRLQREPFLGDPANDLVAFNAPGSCWGRDKERSRKERRAASFDEVYQPRSQSVGWLRC